MIMPSAAVVGVGCAPVCLVGCWGRGLLLFLRSFPFFMGKVRKNLPFPDNSGLPIRESIERAAAVVCIRVFFRGYCAVIAVFSLIAAAAAVSCSSWAGVIRLIICCRVAPVSCP